LGDGVRHDRICREKLAENRIVHAALHVDEGEVGVGFVLGVLMLPRQGCGVGASGVLALRRAPGALKPVLALPGCAQARVPYAVDGHVRSVLLTARSVGGPRWRCGTLTQHSRCTS